RRYRSRARTPPASRGGPAAGPASASARARTAPPPPAPGCRGPAARAAGSDWTSPGVSPSGRRKTTGGPALCLDVKSSVAERPDRPLVTYDAGPFEQDRVILGQDEHPLC